MQQIQELQAKFSASLFSLRRKFGSFDEAFSTYVAQYGDSAVKVHDPIRISGTIEPLIIVLGRTTLLLYRDTKRTLSGSLGFVSIERDGVYVLGRREPPDSKLMLWSQKDEVEIESYDNRALIFPSRIHACIFGLENGDVLFADLGSTAGSIVIGERSKPEPFIALYATPAANVQRVNISPKYSAPKNR